MYVCQTITFERLDVGSSHLHIYDISREYGSCSYMKVICQMVKIKVTGAKKVENPYFRNVKLPTKFRRHVTILAKIISIYLKFNMASAAILDCNTVF